MKAFLDGIEEKIEGQKDREKQETAVGTEDEQQRK